MRAILKGRWWIMGLWIVAAAVLMFTAPNMSELIREKGQFSVPEGYSSTNAAAILEEAAAQKGEQKGTAIALVFHNPDGLGAAGKQEAEKAIKQLEADKQKLGIVSIVEPFSQPELADKMISEDGKTILTSLSIEIGDRTVKEMRQDLNDAMKSVPVEHYFTGKNLIDEDTIESSQEGLKKSEYITVIFILLILFIVFRSFVAPFVPLLTVGISYIVSQQIVAFLVDGVDFPISTFTQIFMVAVMFGIGTDYCILLISRFKEELVHHENTWDAIIATYRTAGKTVFFSALAVLVGFVAIGFAQFMLYRSAVAVAVGIAVMMLALVTIVPFFMAVLGRKLFWPSKGSLEHAESGIYSAAGKFSLKRPWAALLIVAAVSVPLLVTYNGKLSFNSLDEIGDKYDSVKAFNIISDSFGPGESLPGQIVIQNDEPMDNVKYMAVAEKISREVEKVPGVAGVRSVTRPTGDEIKDFEVTKQVGTLSDGLGEGKTGLDKISDGLSKASNELSKNEPQLKEAANGAGELTKGTSQLQSGITQLSDGLKRIEKGIRDGSSGAGDLKAGLQQAKSSAEQLAKANDQLLQAYRQAGAGVAALGDGTKELEQQLTGVSTALTSLTQSFAALEERYPELQQDADYQRIKGTIGQTGTGTAQLAQGLSQIQTNLSAAAAGINQANEGFASAAAGQKALADGLGQIVAGIGQLQSGLKQAADGQGKVIKEIPSIQNGLGQLQGGQEKIQQGFSDLSGQLTQLTDGLNQSVDGIKKVAGGLDSAQDYLTELQNSPDSDLAGWYVPAEALHNKDFQKVFDTYLSKDRKTMTLDVIFAENPYGTEAIDRVQDIEAAVQRAVQGSALEKADVAIGGVTSTFADLQSISNKDYIRTVMLMLAGTFIILVILLRSVIMPIYLIISLLLAYFTSMALTEVVFVNIMGYAGISWVTPFFGFVMLIALGVDYSIFLMDRFNENKGMRAQDAILHAMKNMGTVILSAAVILSGTFAAMYPSGVLSMMQIATVVLSGLVLYSLLFLPFFVPVMVKMFGRANWWPFPNKEQADSADSNRSVGM
ncbi:RND superfamily putative drug exporter [Paenibacillus sp. JGP012]|uniref:MMPL family transporter n=1 Tax=Paenibacillus sp. JGP012 TaxID=2735914 RepID=UPI00160E9BD3|nr:MMPL family transporter [Paenibacillus sp. JGP012]MBB6019274.1 RND superfamily putative drug exporter [Paenibacillus sp. JGP012]